MLQNTHIHTTSSRERGVWRKIRTERKILQRKIWNFANLTTEKEDLWFLSLFLLLLLFAEKITQKHTHTHPSSSLNLYHCKFSSYSHSRVSFCCSSNSPCSDPIFGFHLAGQFFHKGLLSLQRDTDLEVGGKILHTLWWYYPNLEAQIGFFFFIVLFLHSPPSPFLCCGEKPKLDERFLLCCVV